MCDRSLGTVYCLLDVRIHWCQLRTLGMCFTVELNLPKATIVVAAERRAGNSYAVGR